MAVGGQGPGAGGREGQALLAKQKKAPGGDDLGAANTFCALHVWKSPAEVKISDGPAARVTDLRGSRSRPNAPGWSRELSAAERAQGLS